MATEAGIFSALRQYRDSGNVPLRGTTQRSGRGALLLSPHFGHEISG